MENAFRCFPLFIPVSTRFFYNSILDSKLIYCCKLLRGLFLNTKIVSCYCITKSKPTIYKISKLYKTIVLIKLNTLMLHKIIRLVNKLQQLLTLFSYTSSTSICKLNDSSLFWCAAKELCVVTFVGGMCMSYPTCK